MKKALLIMSLVLVTVVLLSFFGCESESYLVSEDGNYKYELITVEDNEVARLVQYIGNESEVTIPLLLDGYRVEKLADGLFVKTISKTESKNKAGVYTANTTLKSITIQNNITELSPRMFYNCTELTTVILPDTITKVGAFAFFGCTKLENIDLPVSVVDIDGYAFRQCVNLKNVNIYSSELPKIGEKAFYYIDNNKLDKDQYSIIESLSINVQNIELFQVEKIDEYFKKSKSMDYIYWNDYINANVLKAIEE